MHCIFFNFEQCANLQNCIEHNGVALTGSFWCIWLQATEANQNEEKSDQTSHIYINGQSNTQCLFITMHCN